MRIALVTSSYIPYSGGLERHVDRLAHGLARQGVEVEVLAQGPAHRLPPVSESDGVVVRQFAASIARPHAAVAPGLYEYMRRTATSFDVTDAHATHVALGAAVAHAGARRLVFTPHGPVQQLMRRRHARAMRALVDHAVHTVCNSRAQAEMLRRALPSAADAIVVVPRGVEVEAIQAAEPFPEKHSIVLSVGRLARYQRVDRAIAAMAGLEPASRLVVVGRGPARSALRAHAADLLVSSRVDFVGAVPDAELYRWLRTARVLVALAEQEASGLQLLETLAAGVPAVASDIPVHREAASYVDGPGVTFVSPAGSPLEIADAICEAARLHVSPATRLRLPTWDGVVDQTLDIYKAAMLARPRTAGSRTGDTGALRPLPVGRGRE
jgi:glycosyltransferase involved in cell wall biosynthesis